MNDKNTILQNPTFVAASELKDICRPLEKLSISYFSHVRVTKSGELSIIGNNPEFIGHYLENEYYNADIHMAKKGALGSFVVWDAIERHGKSLQMHSEAATFGVQHTFTIVEQGRDYNNYYHFANNDTDQSINQTYISNLDLLKLFILHFNESVSQSSLLSHAHALSFHLDEEGEYSYSAQHNLLLPKEKRVEFMNELRLNEFSNISKRLSSIIQTTTRNYSHEDLPKEPSTTKYQPKVTLNQLSKREVECLHLTMRGKSAKQVSSELGISHRTVQEYLTNVKAKLGVASKSELIEQAIILFS